MKNQGKSLLPVIIHSTTQVEAKGSESFLHPQGIEAQAVLHKAFFQNNKVTIAKHQTKSVNQPQLNKNNPKKYKEVDSQQTCHGALEYLSKAASVLSDLWLLESFYLLYDGLVSQVGVDVIEMSHSQLNTPQFLILCTLTCCEFLH